MPPTKRILTACCAVALGMAEFSSSGSPVLTKSVGSTNSLFVRAGGAKKEGKDKKHGDKKHGDKKKGGDKHGGKKKEDKKHGGKKKGDKGKAKKADKGNAKSGKGKPKSGKGKKTPVKDGAADPKLVAMQTTLAVEWTNAVGHNTKKQEGLLSYFLKQEEKRQEEIALAQEEQKQPATLELKPEVKPKVEESDNTMMYGIAAAVLALICVISMSGGNKKTNEPMVGRAEDVGHGALTHGFAQHHGDDEEEHSEDFDVENQKHGSPLDSPSGSGSSSSSASDSSGGSASESESSGTF